MSDVTVEALEKLGIFELRSIARQVGVYSPTTFKKEELIEKIMGIIKGEESPYVRKTNQGRPAKQIASLDDIVNIFVPQKETSTTYEPQQKVGLYSPSMMQNMTLKPENVREFHGYVKILQSYAVVFQNGYFENNDLTYYVTPSMLKESNLKDGDYIRGEYYILDADKPNVVRKIYYVNGVNGDVNRQRERISFEDLSAIYPSQQIRIGTNSHTPIDFKVIDRICPIARGSRVVVNYEDNIDIDDFLVKFINALTNDCQENVTLISMDERPEDLNYIINQCVQLRSLNKKQAVYNGNFYERINNIMAHLMRRVEDGENQIVIVKNMQKMFNSSVKHNIVALSKNEAEAKYFAIEEMKKFLLSAKNTVNDKSLTMIIFNSYIEEANDLCNCFINLKNTCYEDTDVSVDCLTSHALKYNLILSDQEINALLNFKKDLTIENVVPKLNKLFNISSK